MAEFIVNSTGMITNPDEKLEERRAQAILIAVSTTATIALLGVALTLVRIWQQERQTKTAEQGLITDRINKAVEQLGAEKVVKRPSDTIIKKNTPPHDLLPLVNTSVLSELSVPNIEVRIGAIHALERISKDSPRDHSAIMDIICSYIRENSTIDSSIVFPLKPWNGIKEYRDIDIIELHRTERTSRFGDHWSAGEATKWKSNITPLRVDIQTALNVIGRRGKKNLYSQNVNQKLNLSKCNLQGANFENLDISYINFTESKFDGSYISNCRCIGSTFDNSSMAAVDIHNSLWEFSSFDSTNFEGTQITENNFENCAFMSAILVGSNFRSNRISRSLFGGAKMEGTFISKSRFLECDFRRTEMQGIHYNSSIFRECRFVRAQLSDSRFINTNLSDSSIRSCNTNHSTFGRQLDLDEKQYHVHAENFFLRTIFETCESIETSMINFKIDQCKISDCDFRLSNFISCSFSRTKEITGNFRSCGLFNITNFHQDAALQMFGDYKTTLEAYDHRNRKVRRTSLMVRKSVPVNSDPDVEYEDWKEQGFPNGEIFPMV